MKNAPLLRAARFSFGRAPERPRLRQLKAGEVRITMLSAEGRVLQERIGWMVGAQAFFTFEGEATPATRNNGDWCFTVPRVRSDSGES